MPVFEYRGRDNQGQSVSGTLEATSQEAALRDLKNKQILPSLLQQGKRRSDSDIIKSLQRAFKDSRKPKVQPDDLIMFCRQMYALMKAGIPLLRAIGGLADNAKSARLGEVLHQIQRQLQGGTDLATAFAHHKVFDDLFVAMIRMGETTGRLDQAFQQLIFHLEQEKETRKRMISAVRYPSFVLISIAIAMVIINWMVIPEFSKIFNQMHAELPMVTKILIGTSDFTVTYWWAVILAIAVTVFSWVQYLKTEPGRYFWDKTKLRLPLIGGIIERITISRFTRPFAMMLDAGVPLVQALNVSARTVGNEYIGQHIESMVKGVERGDTLLHTAANTGMFNSLLLQMISVGEETGNISSMLNDISDFYDQEIDYDLKNLAENIEPILLGIMGLLVLILLLGVFLPMWDLSSAARGG